MKVEVTPRLFRNRAACECGWHGRSHLFRGGAVLEGGLHLSTHRSADSVVIVKMKAAS
jgi:hypothetical protein